MLLVHCLRTFFLLHRYLGHGSSTVGGLAKYLKWPAFLLASLDFIGTRGVLFTDAMADAPDELREKAALGPEKLVRGRGLLGLGECISLLRLLCSCPS